MADQGASSAAHSLPAAEHVGDGELPVELVVFVLLPLKGDVASLCACACVARAWRQAASLHRLWTRIGPFRPNAAASLTNERLKLLVSRARRGSLKQLDLRGISKSSLDDEGLAEALQHEKRIRMFTASGSPLTGAGIAAALAPSRGSLRELRVCGVGAVPEPASAGAMSAIQYDAFLDNSNKALDDLRALLAPESLLDATAVCEVITGNVVCTRMCDDKNSCECPAAYCKRHADRVFDCQNCGGAVCESCCSNFGDGVCDECFLELSGIVPFGVL